MPAFELKLSTLPKLFQFPVSMTSSLLMLLYFCAQVCCNITPPFETLGMIHGYSILFKFVIACRQIIFPYEQSYISHELFPYAAMSYFKEKWWIW